MYLCLNITQKQLNFVHLFYCVPYIQNITHLTIYFNKTILDYLYIFVIGIKQSWAIHKIFIVFVISIINKTILDYLIFI